MERYLSEDFFRLKVNMAEELVNADRYCSNSFNEILFRLLIAHLTQNDSESLPSFIVSAQDIAAFMKVSPARCTIGLKDLLKRNETKDFPYFITKGMEPEIILYYDSVTQIKRGLYKITLNNELIPYLCNLKSRYLSYPVTDILELKTPYLIKLYEVLVHKRNKCAGKKMSFDFSVTALRDLLELKDKYTPFSQLKVVLNKFIEKLKVLGIELALDVLRKANYAIKVSFKFIPSKKSEKTNANKESNERITEESNFDSEKEQSFRNIVNKVGLLNFFTNKQVTNIIKKIDYKPLIDDELLFSVSEKVTDVAIKKRIKHLDRYFLKVYQNDEKDQDTHYEDDENISGWLNSL